MVQQRTVSWWLSIAPAWNRLTSQVLRIAVSAGALAYALIAEGSAACGAGTTQRDAGRKYQDAMPIARITSGMMGSGIASLTNK